MRPVRVGIYENGEWREAHGLFHQWGLSFEETREGIANYTIGIVELTEGTVVEVLPEKVVFLDKK